MKQKATKIARFLSLVCAVLCAALPSKAQEEINVDPAKGLMTVNIPVHTFDMLDYKVNVGFNYSAKGYQVVGSPAQGANWNLNGKGRITRILRDLPDEKVYSSGDPRRGWLD